MMQINFYLRYITPVFVYILYNVLNLIRVGPLIQNLQLCGDMCADEEVCGGMYMCVTERLCVYMNRTGDLVAVAQPAQHFGRGAKTERDRFFNI